MTSPKNNMSLSAVRQDVKNSFQNSDLLCFLDTAAVPLLVLAFALPLGLVVLADFVCFVITVVSIARVRRQQSSVGDRSAGPHLAVGWRDVMVYAMLVTVTGGAWVFKAIIQFKLRNGIQNYTFIWMYALAKKKRSVFFTTLDNKMCHGHCHSLSVSLYSLTKLSCL
jgi:hypothetical protein